MAVVGSVFRPGRISKNPAVAAEAHGIYNRAPDNYVAYLKAVREPQRHIGKDLEKHLECRNFPTGNGDALQLRVRDIYLMMSGGRAFDIKSDRLLEPGFEEERQERQRSRALTETPNARPVRRRKKSDGGA